MNNWDLYNLVHLAANKDVLSNWLTPPQFELELIAKNIRLMRNLLGLPERYQPGTMQAGASASRVIETDLLPFLIPDSEQTLTNQETDILDWYYINDFWTDTSLSSDIISLQELGQRLNHPIKKATDKYPYAILIKKGLKVWPSTTTKVKVSYYKTPKTPKFVTTVNAGTGELEYDATNSTELEWGDQNKLDIVYMILQVFGVNIEKQDLEQLAQKLVETGK